MKAKKSAVASKWRASATQELSLPSGEVVTVRIPSLDVFVKYGKLPTTLVTKVSEEDLTKSPAEVGVNLLGKLSDEEFAGFMVYAREMVRASLVSPRIVVRDEGDETPLDDDEVAPEDIPQADFWAIFGWSTGLERTVKVNDGEVSASALGNFRQDEGVSAVGEDSGAVRVPPVESVEHPG